MNLNRLRLGQEKSREKITKLNHVKMILSNVIVTSYTHLHILYFLYVTLHTLLHIKIEIGGDGPEPSDNRTEWDLVIPPRTAREPLGVSRTAEVWKDPN